MLAKYSEGKGKLFFDCFFGCFFTKFWLGFG